MRQVGAATIDQIDTRQAILQRDFLGPQMLLHGHRIIGAALNRRVIADNHAFAAFDAANSRNHACARGLIVVHVMRRQSANFEEWCGWIEQFFDPLAWQQLAAGDMTFAGAFRAAFRRLSRVILQRVYQGFHRSAIGRISGAGDIKLGFQNRHKGYSHNHFFNAITGLSRPVIPDL